MYYSFFNIPQEKKIKELIRFVKEFIKRSNKFWLFAIIFTAIYMGFCFLDCIILGRVLAFNLMVVHVWMAAVIIIMAINEKKE